MRRSDLALAAALLAAAGCSVRTLVAVVPDPCATNDAGLPGCAPPGLLDDLIGYWRFDDPAGSLVARDSSGRGNNGTLRNLSTATAWVAGRSGGALEIGAAGWVEVPHSDSIDLITEQVTISAWVYLEGAINSVDLYGTAISRQIGTGIEQYYHLSINLADHPTMFVTTSGGTAIPRPPDQNSPVPATPQRTWTHIAGTYDGASARIYLNGTEVPGVAMHLTGTFAKDTTPVILGGNTNNSDVTELFPGRIDEIMLYRRALSATEIGELAAGVLFPGGPVDAGTD